MATTERIKTRCPICRSKYTVPKALIGHRARCARCKTTFRVAEHNHHPTEDDILRWLNEDMEEYEFANRPRIIRADSTSTPSTRTSDDQRPGPTSTPTMSSNHLAASIETAPHPHY